LVALELEEEEASSQRVAQRFGMKATEYGYWTVIGAKIRIGDASKQAAQVKRAGAVSVPRDDDRQPVTLS
jgi:hypothetical protein